MDCWILGDKALADRMLFGAICTAEDESYWSLTEKKTFKKTNIMMEHYTYLVSGCGVLCYRLTSANLLCKSLHPVTYDYIYFGVNLSKQVKPGYLFANRVLNNISIK